MEKRPYRKTLPKFYRLDILKCLDGPEIWWKRDGVCTACGRQKWDFTVEGIQSTVTTSSIYNPREVYANTWKNELIFNLQDPGLPIVTQKFLDIVNAVCIEKIELKKAMWV